MNYFLGEIITDMCYDYNNFKYINYIYTIDARWFEFFKLRKVVLSIRFRKKKISFNVITKEKNTSLTLQKDPGSIILIIFNTLNYKINYILKLKIIKNIS